MYPKLLHLYGPFEINSFNATLMVGIGLFLYLAHRDSARKQLISGSDFLNISIESALAGIIGGRVLHIISEWHVYHSIADMFSVWNGGLSILGALAGVVAYSAFALKRKGLPLLACYDIAVLYAPLIHAIARIGCFLVGCCHGCPTDVAWGITYTNPLVAAPLHIKIHPTQLYSSLFFFVLFIVLMLVRKRLAVPGQLGCLYIMGMTFERFCIDFLRGDRILMSQGAFDALSFHQWISLAMFIAALGGFIVLQGMKKPHESV
jgi:phosphatidylglycerol---prolipoprotein diacylglyceryl transferase